MLLENLFGGIFGFIWLSIFIVGVLSLIVWQLVKKDKVSDKQDSVEKIKEVEEVKEIKELIKEEYKGLVIEEVENNIFVVKSEGKIVKKFDKYTDCKVFIDVVFLRKENDSNYDIVEIDGSFKVRKKGSERTIRKFDTYEDAENFVKEKENND